MAQWQRRESDGVTEGDDTGDGGNGMAMPGWAKTPEREKMKTTTQIGEEGCGMVLTGGGQ
ncbi:hypothetical protein E2562_009595 [Oryza meyeriana var. granulata]|uniref:DUF834 domain-containing protein n=1 Tax=Oryza meyeriana var. granulata TaxID=110450 RepID=A0A6G1F5Z5_9ORYZ|nr:hypothetical protein E2562_009595 [Oryza meyeriana var. granulata]